jgi:hypothetical protein
MLIKFVAVFFNEKSFRSAGRQADIKGSKIISRGHVKSSINPL